MNPVRLKLEQRNVAGLANGYSKHFRGIEIAGIIAFFVLLSGLVARLWSPAANSPWLVLSAVLIAYLAADFVSGFVHWLGDTWGTPDWPILGQSIIRPFREHHVDQTAITRHDFIETNGSNCLISLPVALAGLFTPLPVGDSVRLFLVSFMSSLIVWVFATNQFHRWAHLSEPTGLIAWLQRLHLVLPPAHHAIHHAAPHRSYYCITVGWLNWPLTKFRFFPCLERLITTVTGALPRKDDIGEAAALLVCEADASSSMDLSSATVAVPLLTRDGETST